MSIPEIDERRVDRASDGTTHEVKVIAITSNFVPLVVYILDGETTLTLTVPEFNRLYPRSEKQKIEREINDLQKLLDTAEDMPGGLSSSEIRMYFDPHSHTTIDIDICHIPVEALPVVENFINGIIEVIEKPAVKPS